MWKCVATEGPEAVALNGVVLDHGGIIPRRYPWTCVCCALVAALYPSPVYAATYTRESTAPALKEL